MSPNLPVQAQNKGLSHKALMNVLVRRRGLGGQGAGGTKQPCVLLGERWDLLARVDVMGASPAKPTGILMPAAFGLHILSCDSSGQMVSEALSDKAPSHRPGKSCTT